MATKYGNKYRKYFEEAKKNDSYWINLITLKFATSLWGAMQKKNIKSSELARLIGKSPAYITKVLRGDTNYTIETLYKLSNAVGCKIEINIVDEESKQNEKWETNGQHSLVTLINHKSNKFTESANNNDWTDILEIEDKRSSLRVAA